MKRMPMLLRQCCKKRASLLTAIPELIEESPMTDMTVAKTILQQLGGKVFTMMTGAKNFTGDKTTLTFSLPGAGGFTKQGINRVAVALTPLDTYTVTFYRLRKGNPLKVVAERTMVYCDQLRAVFTEVTGLEVSL